MKYLIVTLLLIFTQVSAFGASDTVADQDVINPNIKVTFFDFDDEGAETATNLDEDSDQYREAIQDALDRSLDEQSDLINEYYN